jgi:hypothetical protein
VSLHMHFLSVIFTVNLDSVEWNNGLGVSMSHHPLWTGQTLPASQCISYSRL